MKSKNILVGIMVCFLCLSFVPFTDGASAASAPAEYPGTTEGIKQFIEEVLTAVEAEDKEKVASLVRGMALPKPGEWFQHVFGEKTGEALATGYRKQLPTLERELTSIFVRMVKEGNTEVRVKRFTDAADREGTGGQRRVLAAMKNPVPLYSVRMVKPGQRYGMHLWSFVYVEGGFRLAGKMYRDLPKE